MHSESSPFVYRAYMRAHKTELTAEDSWFLASVMMLRYITNVASTTEVTQRLLDMCARHSVLQQVQRIGLVRRLGNANQLRVIASNNASGEPNSMPSDYSCFVNATGSLFDLKPMSVRYFADAAEVVASFAARNHPPQRSIARVAQMKLGSGLCSGVFASERLVGLVFLNGRLSQVELDKNNIALLLEALCAAVRTYYEPYFLSQAYWTLAAVAGDVFAGRRFTFLTLQELALEQLKYLTGQTWDIKLSGDLGARPVLVSHGNIAQIIARSIAAAAVGPSIDVRAKVEQDSLRIDFSLSTPCDQLAKHVQLALAAIGCDAVALGMAWRMEGERAVLTVPADYAADDVRIDYSVEL